ncbi:amino acid adenylation domain-containing protein [Corallococcus sp. BB11-1]|uniref:non-ribosomal peptide synthetase n=1 Tax=Corallococcus sp. BB11-1 TaxID=2996783 RepID=UPI00226D8A4B|nr:non-ribosomal peptide synthetase [Corallococcus sp. BB11-1]MCY1035330.1 amino acid adenylation domain-containing protein [Corallococcus sp. BB11-1]
MRETEDAIPTGAGLNQGDAQDPARGADTLVGLLRERARQEPGFALYTFLVDGEAEEERLTCAELDRRARRIAAGLRGLAPGERVLLVYPPGLDYITAFFGCLYAGVVAVPVYPPRHDRSLARLQAIAQDARATAGLIRTEHLELLRQFFPLAPDLEQLTWWATDTLPVGSEDAWTPPALTGADRAFFQYTSGSTSLPKGVMLSHQHLLRNLEAIRRRFQQTRASKVVTWLPPYHDMGLIGGLLQPLYTGYPAVMMSPADFLLQPLRWLRTISRHGATTSGGPDFAYALCVRKATPEQCEGLDLSSWRVAFNGAEPIRPETLEGFVRTFGPYGFRRDTFLPCYGLAEATLLVAGGEAGHPTRVEAFDGGSLQRGQAVAVEAGREGAQALVSSGRNALDGRLLIVDPERRSPLPEGTIGEIWVSGSSVAGGYWNRPDAARETFQATLRESGEGPFLRTGDLGFMRDEELFVTGRAKDLLILRGLNHYPQDLERTVERSHPALRPGSGAAFSVEAGGEERLVIVYEVSAKLAPDGLDPVIEAIRREVPRHHELTVYAVELLEPGSVPKTSSGKIQRHACRAGFLAGELQPLARFALSGAPGAEDGPGETASAPAWAPASALASEVLEEVTGVLTHGVRDDREPLWFDSLSSVDLQHRLQARFQVNVPLSRLLSGASLAQLVCEVEAARAGQGATGATLTPTGPATGDFPLSHGQRALWFLHQLAPGSAAYHIAAALRVLEPLDAQALRRAVLRLVEHHPALRTTFHAAGGEPFQRIHEAGVLDLESREATGWSPEDLQQALREEALKPFDLERGPLLRVRLFQRGGGEHALLVVVHHLVADLWSLGQLARELSVAYPAALRGERAELSDAPHSYVDFVRWQRVQWEDAAQAGPWAYWKQQLAGPAPVLDRLADHRRPSVQTYRGGRRERRLAPELTSRLKRLGGLEGTTVFAALLAGYATLLHRHNGQRELWVGTPTAGRERVEQAGTVGYFVNPVVLRVELTPELPFRALVADVGRSVREALEHAALPLGVLVERLAPARDPGRSPLFQTMFALQQLPLRGDEGLAALALGVGGARLSLAGLAMESIALDLGTSQFDLSLSVAEVDGRLHVTLEYNADLFDAATAERLLQRYETLLAGAVLQPEAPLGALPIAPEVDRARLLDWGRPAESPPPACVQTWIEARARQAPDAIAVLSVAGALTYAELDARANALAWRLCALGVGPDVPVALYLERSLEQVIAVLGVLKAGGAYVPLDPEFNAARLETVLADANLRVVITGPGFDAGAHRVTAVTVGDARETRREPPPVALDPEHLAYVIYTSGSTGRPKGVMVSHRALASFIHAERGLVGLTPEDRVLQFNSLSFDTSVEELFLTLTAGATLVLRDAAMLATPEAFLEGSRRWGITLWDLPTAFWHSLTAALEERDLALPASLRSVIIGGEQARAERVAQWYRRASADVRLLNTYGPTEATVAATFFDLEARTSGDLEVVPIGRASKTMGAFVLDARLEPVPTGGVGELWLAGAGLARGYLAEPALTAERFRPHPHATTPGERLYRTGDLARFRADGVLDFLGRADAQVKVRGFRVELGEIEAVLRTCEGVRDGLVLLRAGTHGGAEGALVAYAVAPPEVTVPALRAHLAARLPPYMVPAHFVRLDAFPTNASGKVDRRALPVPEASEEGLAPRTEAEARLAGIWAEVLGVGRVGVDQGFFELGGHSLLAMRVLSRIRDAFGVELPLRALFEDGTVAALAIRLEQAREGARPALPPPPAPVARGGGPLPLSFAQQRLWLLARMEPDSSAYNEPGVLRLSGPLDPTALAEALVDLLRRHEVLRTRVVEHDGAPVQRVEPEQAAADLLRQHALPHGRSGGHAGASSQGIPPEGTGANPRPHEPPRDRLGEHDRAPEQSTAREARAVLPVEDLRSLSSEAREARAAAIVHEEAARPFAMDRAPLLRMRLLRLGDEEHRLVAVLHHIVCDAGSLGILFHDLAALYEARRDGRTASLPVLSVQYADFAVWQRGWLQGDVLERQLTYWRKVLDGAPAERDVPFARGARTSEPGPSGTVHRALPHTLGAPLEALCRREGVTPFMALLATFQALLQRYTGEHDVLVGTPVAHRTHGALEALVGFFVNTLVLRTHVPKGGSFRQLLARAREDALGAFSHPDLPFEKLVESLKLARTSSRPPFLQFMFALQDAPRADLVLSGLRATLEEPPPAQAKFDLLLELSRRGDGWHASWQFDTARFDSVTVGRMAEHFERLLTVALSRPDAPLAHLPLLTEAEQALIARANDTGPTVPRDASIPRRFEAQADRTPDAIAVERDGQSLTYRELDAKANRLAHTLHARGVGPDVPVGLCLSRSFELIIGMLGVLKAGGAYLPLDPQEPPERRTRLLTNAGARWVLTQTALSPVGDDAGASPIDLSGPAVPGQPEGRLASSPHADTLAYVMHTSGSTGHPKAVCVPHRAVLRLVTHPNYLTLTAEDAFLQLAPPSFDAATLEVWAPLLNGGRLVLFPGHGAAALETLGQVVARHRVTCLWLTAGLFHGVVDQHPEALTGVRQLLAGGDVLSPEHVRRVLERHPLRVINGYGPTENTTFTCCHPMASPEQVESPVPIGAPITGTRVHVLDAMLAPVPVGVPGELYCAGDGLARGYLGQPDLTAERFLPDPFSQEPGTRMYRTGDRARWREDGRIDFLGRVDQQVKVRGFRVEPGEVEAALLSHPDVRDAAVVAVGARADTRRLVAHVVLRDAATLPPEALRAFLGEKLPEHLVPGAVTLHEALPLTPNGKVDRRALATTLLTEGATDPAALTPRTRTEALLAALWTSLLGLPHVGPHENFFALGGHSLMAMRLLSRVREATGVTLGLKTLFEAATLATLAERIDAARSALPSASARPLAPVPREGPLPLSFAQQRLWFIAQLDPVSAAYHIPGALHLTGDVDVPLLERCFNTLLERHEVLRTAFVSRDGTPIQQVAPRLTLTLPVEDLRALPPTERQARARDWERSDAEQPFALDAPPLLRVRLLRLEDREHRLLLTLHHIVSDGWSLGVLFREVTALYEAFAAGRDNPLPPLPIQYADYAWWQREWLQGPVLEEQLQFWTRHLTGAPPRLRLPFDRPPPEIPSHRGSLVVGRIDAARTSALEAWGRGTGATLFMTTLAAFFALLHRLTGASDLVVGTPTANRTHPFTEDLIGFFVNTLALRCQVRADLGFAQLLEQVRTLALAAHDHQDVPFERVVNALGSERSLSHNPVFQVLFAFQNAPLSALRLRDLSLSEVEPNFDVVKFDLVVIVQEQGGALTVTWSYATDLFDAPTIARMHQQYAGLLDALLADPGARVGRVEQAPPPAPATRRTSDFERLRTIKPRPLPVPPRDEDKEH